MKKKKKSIGKKKTHKIKAPPSPLQQKVSMEELLTQTLCCVSTETIIAYLPRKIEVLLSECDWQIGDEERFLMEIGQGWYKGNKTKCKLAIKSWKKRKDQLVKTQKILKQMVKMFDDMKKVSR